MTPGLALDSGEFIPASELNMTHFETKRPKEHTPVMSITEENEKLKQRIANLEVQLASGQEPAATVIKNGASRQWMSEKLGKLPDGIYSIYTHSAPAQQPLSDEQIGAILGTFADHAINIARAIEAAHGIKEKP